LKWSSWLEVEAYLIIAKKYAYDILLWDDFGVEK